MIVHATTLTDDGYIVYLCNQAVTPNCLSKTSGISRPVTCKNCLKAIAKESESKRGCANGK